MSVQICHWKRYLRIAVASAISLSILYVGSVLQDALMRSKLDAESSCALFERSPSSGRKLSLKLNTALDSGSGLMRDDF